MPTGTCPNCDGDIDVKSDADKGDVFECEECFIGLEIVGLEPLELAVEGDDDLDDEEYGDDDDEF